MLADRSAVVGLLQAPPSPTLPPAFHVDFDAAAAAAAAGGSRGAKANSGLFSVLADGEGEGAGDAPRTDVVDEDLPNGPFRLQHQWTLYYDKKQTAGKGKTAAVPPKQPGSVGSSSSSAVASSVGTSGVPEPLAAYESNLHTVGSFSTVEEFWSLQNHLVAASALDQNSTVHCFRSGIKPIWEDEHNRLGGKWIFRLASKDKPLLDHCWQNVLLAVIGGVMDDSPSGDAICGCVLSRRRMGDRIALWNGARDPIDAVIALGHRFRAALLEGLPPEWNPTIQLAYEDNEIATAPDKANSYFKEPTLKL